MIEIKNIKKGVLSISCSSELEHLDSIVDESEEFLAQLIDDEELAYKVILLLTEAVTNAIEHGNELDKTRLVQVEVKVGTNRITIEVEDEGQGFEREQVADPIEGDNLLNDGGRGIFLIEQMADEVHFKKDGSRVQIVFHR